MKENHSKKLFAIFSMICLIGSILSGFRLGTIVGGTQESPSYGGTLVVALGSDPGTLFPLRYYGPHNQIFSPLIDRWVDDEGNLGYRSNLAERWEISEDGLTYTFYLLSNVTWHDGTPFSSADVKFTFELYLDPEVTLLQSGFYKVIDHIDTPDDTTVVFHLKHPSPTLMPLGFGFWRGHLILPKHLYEGTDILANPYNQKPIGTGPFKFKEWKQGEYITFERNAAYYRKGLPYLDQIIYQVIPSDSTGEFALETGDVGFLAELPDWPTTKRLMELETVQVFRTWQQLGIIGYIAMNQGTSSAGKENPILQNQKVRYALAHALDWPTIQTVMGGGIGRAYSWVGSELTEFYEPNVPKYEYNPTKAKQLLDEAGYSSDETGRRFTLRWNYETGSNPAQKFAEIIKEQLGKVEIELDLIPLGGAIIGEKLLNYDFDLAWYARGSGPDPDWLYEHYHSSQISPGSHNFIRYNNSQVDTLWDQSRTMLDPIARADVFKQMQRIIMEDLPIIPLIEWQSHAASRVEFRGLNETGPYLIAHHFDRVWWDPGPVGEFPNHVRGAVLVLGLAGVMCNLARRKRKKDTSQVKT